MTFDVDAGAYERFMGRFSAPLAAQFIDFAGVEPGHRVLDVGCGPGALTQLLVERVGAPAVAAVDPSRSFVTAARARFPTSDVQVAGAEHLPFADDSFDRVLAQLVVNFLNDPVAGLREMGRVARPGGRVAVCVWDLAGTTGPLAVFWRAVREQDPAAADESASPGGTEGQLAALAAAAGLTEIEASSLTVQIPITSFDAWWEPFTLGVGPAGAYVARLTDDDREALRLTCRELLPSDRFDARATAWCVRASA